MILIKQAIENLAKQGIKLTEDFHTLNSMQIESLLSEAKLHGYRKPKNANGSTARYFFEACKRKAFPKFEILFYVQGNYGKGFEDVTCESSFSEARARLREYRENDSNPYRLIKRREKINAAIAY